MTHRNAMVAGFSLSLAIMAIAVIAGSVRSPSRGVPVAQAQRNAADVSAPCIGQDGVTLNDAEAAQGFPVLLPSTDEANIDSISDVCEADGGGVAILYSSGVALRESPNDLSDPTAAWKGIVVAYPGAGYQLIQVRGQDALAAEPGGGLKVLGGLSWVENGVKFEITGNGSLPLEDLVAIADSLAPSAGSPVPSATATP